LVAAMRTRMSLREAIRDQSLRITLSRVQVKVLA
jgi:hypothetical protein